MHAKWQKIDKNCKMKCHIVTTLISLLSYGNLCIVFCDLFWTQLRVPALLMLLPGGPRQAAGKSVSVMTVGHDRLFLDLLSSTGLLPILFSVSGSTSPFLLLRCWSTRHVCWLRPLHVGFCLPPFLPLLLSQADPSCHLCSRICKLLLTADRRARCGFRLSGRVSSVLRMLHRGNLLMMQIIELCIVPAVDTKLRGARPRVCILGVEPCVMTRSC